MNEREDIESCYQHQQPFDNGDNFTVFGGVPVGYGADETIIAEGEKVPVGVIVVYW